MPRAKKSNWSVPSTDGGLGGDVDAKYHWGRLQGRSTYESEWAEMGVLKAVLDMAENDLAHPYWRLDAVQWITARLNDGEDWGVTSFEYICEAMGLDPEATRVKLLRRAEEYKDEAQSIRFNVKGRGSIILPADS